MKHLPKAALIALLAGTALATPAQAQTASELQARIDAQDARIRELEAKLEQLTQAQPAAPAAPSGAAAGYASAGTAATGAPVASGAVSSSPAPVQTASRLALSGDIRTRYETNFGDKDARTHDRGVLRARLRAAYKVNDWLMIGGQLATGDADDPNSTDITLGSFDDDLDASLDQAYLKGTFAKGNLVTYLGKIPQPFVRTELVWDGDVSPQGASASYKLPLSGGGAITATGLYFLIDESTVAKDSNMVGGQLGIQTASDAPVKLEAYVGYYDYRLKSVEGADAGDFRSNRRLLNGRYLSDFNLLDAIAMVTWNGLGKQWPVKLVGDYVHNFGAADDEDTGFSADLLVGNALNKGDWRFGYGYAEADVDAVLAAFSHDNTNIATNYMQHTFAIDYVPTKNVILNATLYHYKPKSALFAGANDPDDWIDRLRLNFLVNF